MYADLTKTRERLLAEISKLQNRAGNLGLLHMMCNYGKHPREVLDRIARENDMKRSALQLLQDERRSLLNQLAVGIINSEEANQALEWRETRIRAIEQKIAQVYQPLHTHINRRILPVERQIVALEADRDRLLSQLTPANDTPDERTLSTGVTR